MANRPVYVPIARPPFYRVANVEFEFNPGFSVSQKQKNIEAIHSAFLRSNPDSTPLEISSKSMQPLGVSLSAFLLKKRVPSLGICIPVENAYQGAKKFAHGGPYTDLYRVSPKDAKRDDRLNTSGPMRAFTFEGVDYPLEPKNGFYDWLYIQALHENPEYAEQVLKYNAFTDVEFNPNKSINCQARAAAMFVGITSGGLINKTFDFFEFCKMVEEKAGSVYVAPVNAAPKPTPVPETKAIPFCEGQLITHPAFGEGKITMVNGEYLKILFACGEKIIGAKWTQEHCKF